MHKTLIGVLVSIGILAAAAGSGYYFYNQGKATGHPPTGEASQKCQNAPVVSSFKVDPTQPFIGGAGQLSWDVKGAESVEIYDGYLVITEVEVEGYGRRKLNDLDFIVIKPIADTTYVLTARCGDKSATKTLLVTVRPTPTPATTKNFGEKRFSITTPAGWKVAKFNSFVRSPDEGSEKFAYTDGQGNYFAVEIDKQGSEIYHDQRWGYKLNANKNGLIISSETECEKGGLACGIGDGRLDIFSIPDSANVEIKGHGYTFYAGNTKKESGVNLQVFRDILKSFRAK